jgi:hypothetical protein
MGYRFGPAKTDCNIGICCFSTKNSALKSKEQILVGSESG